MNRGSGAVAARRGAGYIGRNDFQVKIRGRIELGEIEATLATHPAVRQAAAAVHELRPEDKALVAYVVIEEHSGAANDAALQDYLRTRLPEYMVPQHFMRLESLPTTISGKLRSERPA